MRILFITASYLPTINGVTYHIKSTAQALRRLGHKVYILAPSFPGYKNRDKYIIRYPSLPNPFIKDYPLGVPLLQTRKIKRLDIDVVHTHHPLIVGQAAYQIADKLSKPLFFTAHTQYEQYLNYYFPHGYDLTSQIMINDLKKMSKVVKKIICPSINTEKRLKKNGIINTVIVSNGIEKFFFIKPSHKPLTSPTIVYTGRLEREKNLFELIRVARELKKMIPNFKLIILGSGSLYPKLRERVSKLKLDDNIVFAGLIERGLIPGIYKSVHLFITTSISEVMPISILEAMASGIPIIALIGSGLEEIVIDGRTGYLCDKKPRRIAERIKEVLTNKDSYRKLASETYKYSQNFTSKNTAQKLLKLYTSKEN